MVLESMVTEGTPETPRIATPPPRSTKAVFPLMVDDEMATVPPQTKTPPPFAYISQEQPLHAYGK
jgi:hypothetical protein